jgi:hypothetical protein
MSIGLLDYFVKEGKPTWTLYLTSCIFVGIYCSFAVRPLPVQTQERVKEVVVEKKVEVEVVRTVNVVVEKEVTRWRDREVSRTLREPVSVNGKVYYREESYGVTDRLKDSEKLSIEKVEGSSIKLQASERQSANTKETIHGNGFSSAVYRLGLGYSGNWSLRTFDGTSYWQNVEVTGGVRFGRSPLWLDATAGYSGWRVGLTWEF